MRFYTSACMVIVAVASSRLVKVRTAQEPCQCKVRAFDVSSRTSVYFASNFFERE